MKLRDILALAAVTMAVASCSGESQDGDGSLLVDAGDGAEPDKPGAKPNVPGTMLPGNPSPLDPDGGPLAADADTTPEPLPDAAIPDAAPPRPKGPHRNPEHPLVCSRPLTENPASSPLVRLTHFQYVNTLADLFAGLVAEADLPRVTSFSIGTKAGVFSNNAADQSLSETDMATREAAVVTLANAAVKNLSRLMGCEASTQTSEAACVDTFIEGFGSRAWRRPLRDPEREALKDLFLEARKEFDLSDSVNTLVGALLQSPQFLYRVQEGIGDVGEGKSKRLNAYEVASNLSYVLWSTMPDDELFAAAKDGSLLLTEEVEKQARRMLKNVRARPTIRLFAREWLRVERLAERAHAGVKDATTYPSYKRLQSDGLVAGLEAFLDDAFWEGEHSLRRLLTSSRGFVNDASAAIYGVPPPNKSEVVGFDLNQDQRRGLLTQPLVMAGLGTANAQSPSQRGAYVMSTLLCAPSPSDDMVRKLVEVNNRNELTLRQVVQKTVQPPACQTCHNRLDGLGFLFENYDGVGTYQTHERALSIDASSSVEGTYDLDGPYANAVGFAESLARSEQAAQCAVQHFYEFAMARSLLPEDGCIIPSLTDGFVRNGTDIHQLVIDLVKSSAFRFRSAATP